MILNIGHLFPCCTKVVATSIVLAVLMASSMALAAGRRRWLARRRVSDRCLETARDGRVPAEDRLDVALCDLLLKQGIGYGDWRIWIRYEEPYQ